MKLKHLLSGALISTAGLILVACGGEGPIAPPPPVPAEYADKHMPEGGWTDPAALEEGKKIYEGQFDVDVNCASCHGRDGKPKKRGARDFRVTERMKLYSDSAWYWRIAEGVPKTKMKPWKKKLTEEQIWKVVAYTRTFGLKDMGYDVARNEWVPVAELGKPSSVGAPAAGASTESAPKTDAKAPEVK